MLLQQLQFGNVIVAYFTPLPLPTGAHSTWVRVSRCLSCAGMPQQTAFQGPLCLCGALGLRVSTPGVGMVTRGTP